MLSAARLPDGAESSKRHWHSGIYFLIAIAAIMAFGSEAQRCQAIVFHDDSIVTSRILLNVGIRGRWAKVLDDRNQAQSIAREAVGFPN